MKSSLIDILCSSNGNFRDRPYSDSMYNLSSELIEACFCDWFDERSYIDDAIREEYSKTFELVNKLEMSLRRQFVDVDVLERSSVQEWLGKLYQIININKVGCFVKKEKISEMIIRNKPYKTMESMGVESVKDLLDVTGASDALCLTRIFEDEEWHKRQYEVYSTLRKRDFEEREISISIFGLEQFTVLPLKLIKKKTIWEDKIGGTIFGVPYPTRESSEIPFTRMSTRFFHYIFELMLHCKYIESIIEHPFLGSKIAKYIRDDDGDVDFFEPHFLLETFSWQFAMDEYLKNFRFINDELLRVKKQGILFFSNRNFKVVSYDINDIVSNASQNRNVPGEHRMLSMKFKKSLLNVEHTDKQLLSMLLQTLGHGSLFVKEKQQV